MVPFVLIAVLLLPGFTSLTGTLVQAATSADDWRMFRNDASRTGFSSSNAPTSLVLPWSYPTEEGVQSSPAKLERRFENELLFWLILQDYSA